MQSTGGDIGDDAVDDVEQFLAPDDDTAAGQDMASDNDPAEGEEGSASGLPSSGEDPKGGAPSS
ncbi:hypothetical protein HC251_02850 [Iamia sp. SCSIO 61187]|uniref:hypothetical protein n=1 Tax=Iamia sp. SCSIO 61187 TaxID=2722752 RepID=UPI001C62F99A|nr:hypothetical protein [Iamia sp. SCSIO 61187]QYG91478.1 hypothetical protein HC251_02850 [Iamia sp. SCSIO 61187]